MMKFISTILFVTVVMYCSATSTTSSNYKAPNYLNLLPGFDSCVFNGIKYPVGQTFHPRVQVNNTMMEDICAFCTCHPTTVAQCEKTQCPALECDNPITLSGECCQVCPGENEAGINLESAKPKSRDCTLGGITYEHGSKFHPPSSVHSHTEYLYCTVYSCDNGTLSFSNVSDNCPSIMGCDPSEAFHVPGSCCKVCPEVALNPGECKDELGQPRMQNETWNPYSAAYQTTLTCINCSCISGTEKFKCFKMPCPPVPPCTEDDVIEDIVLCCPKCSNNPFSTLPTEAPTLNDTIPEIESCSYTHKVYLCNTSSVAIESTQNRSVTNYVWLSNGVKQIFTYSSEEFLNLDCSHKEHFVGGTSERRVKGLQNKEVKRKIIEDCTNNCGKLVARMLYKVEEDPCKNLNLS